MTNINLESCIIEIKQAIARIEEQIKTIFKVITEQKEYSDRLHKEHFDDTEEIRKSITEINTRVSQHDVELTIIKQTIERLVSTLEDQTKIIARTKGIAIGLGMTGGAIVSILTLLAQIIR
ncbi:MAG: hypothetical protein J7M32_03840 [Deltaproteobacteria bacterium]|nr:hypothetical protein [Deltaproteobacteria bacterium]